MDLNEPPHDKFILKKELKFASLTFKNVSRKTSVLPVWIGLFMSAAALLQYSCRPNE